MEHRHKAKERERGGGNAAQKRGTAELFRLHENSAKILHGKIQLKESQAVFLAYAFEYMTLVHN